MTFETTIVFIAGFAAGSAAVICTILGYFAACMKEARHECR